MGGDTDQFGNTPEMHKILKDPLGVPRRIFVYGITPQEGQIDQFRSELERTFRKYGLIEAMIVKKRFSFVQFLHENGAQQAIRTENGKIFMGQKMDVKEVKAPAPKKEDLDDEEEDDNSSSTNYNIASSLAETLKNLPKEDFEPPAPAPAPGPTINDRFDKGDHNFDSMGGRGGPRGGRGAGRGFPPVLSDRGGRGGGRGGMESPRGGYHGSPGGYDSSVGRGPGHPSRGRGDEGGRGRGMDRGRGDMFRGRGMSDRGRGGRGAYNSSFSGGNGYEEDHSPTGPMPSDRGGMMGGRGARGRGFERGGRGGGAGPPGGDRWNKQEYGGPPNDRWGAGDDLGPPKPAARPVGGPSVKLPQHVSNEDRANDVEIIVCDRNLTEYAEFIEIKLKKIDLAVDLLFPKEEVPLDKVIANISSRGTLYAIVVMHQHEQRRSMTLHILHGVPQEHRNIPVDDALELIDKNFQSYKKGDKKAPKTGPGGIEVSLKSGLPLEEKHPDLMQALLSKIAENQSLTALEYERVISYLQDRREKQCLLEVNDEDLTDIMSKKNTSEAPDTSVAPNTQNSLQNRIMGLLNKPKGFSGGPGGMSLSPFPVPNLMGSMHPEQQMGGKKEPILQDPTVQRALQSLFQGNHNPLMGGGRGSFSGR